MHGGQTGEPSRGPGGPAAGVQGAAQCLRESKSAQPTWVVLIIKTAGVHIFLGKPGVLYGWGKYDEKIKEEKRE